MPKFQSVLFVCWGNVCRSPAAELMLKREAKRLGLKGLRIESAGVAADFETKGPSFGMKWAAFRRGLWLRPNPTLFRKLDCKQYDLIIAMDRQVQISINAIAGREQPNVKLLSDFLPREWPRDVPDPMKRSVGLCNDVLEMLQRACHVMTRYIAPVNTHHESISFPVLSLGKSTSV